jgi:hypothetical protein
MKLSNFVQQFMVIAKLHMRCEDILEPNYIFDQYEYIYIIIFHADFKL